MREQRTLLLQFIALSLLLHVLVVLVFGSRVAGVGPAGGGAKGVLDVTLRQLSPEPGTGFTLAPGIDSLVPGTALLRRLSEAVRERRAPSPPAAKAPAPAAATPPPAPAPASTPPDVAPLPAPAAPRFEALPHFDRTAPEEVDRPIVPPPAPLGEPAPEPVRAPPAAAEPARREVPLAAPAPEVIPSAPPAAPEIAPPPTPREVPAPIPAPPAIPAPAPTPREIPAPAPMPREAPLPARELPTTPPPSAVPEVSPSPAPPVVERETRPAAEVPAPRQVPVENVAPIERGAPATRSEPATAPAAPSRVEPVEAAPRVAPPAAVPGTAPAREPARPSASPADTAPGGLGPSAIDDEVFRGKGSVIAPSPDPAAAPRIDLEATRRRAREIAAEGSGSPGVLPVVPLPPEKVKKPNLAEAIAKAAKPDCRTAYAELGLLAIPPLVASTVGDGGCRW